MRQWQLKECEFGKIVGVLLEENPKRTEINLLFFHY